MTTETSKGLKIDNHCRCNVRPTIVHHLCSYVFRFANLEQLGEAILAKDPHNRDVSDALRRLRDEQRALDEMWAARNRDLENARALQVFLREADQIDSVSASHEAFLEYNDLGVSTTTSG